MTKLNEPEDDALAKLYSTRKSQHSAPITIKRQILAKQQNTDNFKGAFRRMSYVAVAASTLLLFGLFTWQQKALTGKQSHYQIVQIHELSTSEKSPSDDIRSRYAKHYQEYISRSQTYTQHHKKRAVLSSIENGWQLTTCDKEIVQLSGELVEALNRIQQIDTQLTSGDTVEVAFDQTGIILGIQQSGNYLQC